MRAGIQRKNLETETEAVTMEKCSLLSCNPWLVQPAFTYIIQFQMSRGGINQKGLKLPKLVAFKKMPLQSCL